MTGRHRLTAEDDRRYLGQTMGLDESQMRFATPLQTGEALVYSDEFAEAAHVTVTPALRPSAPGAVTPVPVVPFTACDRCRSQCAYRAARLAMVRDPIVVGRIKDDVAAWEVKGLAAKDIEGKWATLLGRLRAQVASFPSRPQPSQASATQRTACSGTHSRSVPCASRHRGQRPWRPGSASPRSPQISECRRERDGRFRRRRGRRGQRGCRGQR